MRHMWKNDEMNKANNTVSINRKQRNKNNNQLLWLLLVDGYSELLLSHSTSDQHKRVFGMGPYLHAVTLIVSRQG